MEDYWRLTDLMHESRIIQDVGRVEREFEKLEKLDSISTVIRRNSVLPMLDLVKSIWSYIMLSPSVPLSLKLKIRKALKEEDVRLMHEISRIMKNIYSSYKKAISKKDCTSLIHLNTISLTYHAADIIRVAWKLAFNREPPRFVFVSHHLTHAASAYYTSGMNKAVGVVIDSRGEWESTSIWSIKDGEFERIASLSHPKYSLGIFYQESGEWIGYGGLEGPAKIMGLAPYGKPNEKFTNVINELLKVFDEPKDVPYRIEKVKSSVAVLDYLKSVLGEPIKWDKNGKPLNRDATDFAWALQHRVEEAYLATMRWAKELTGLKEAVIAGGVALNAKANMELLYSDIFNDFFVFPAANDAGTAVGAALWAYEHVLGGKVKNVKIENVFWGLEHDEEDIEEALNLAKRMNYRIEKDVDIEHLVDKLLKNELVVVYQGRAEFGPRALGHRSIVADPRIAENWERVNFHKGREWWRPLAPSLLLDHAKEYFIKGEHLPFMIVMERYKDEEVCKRVPVVCHVDRTARPQTVTTSIDRNWYNLIRAFGQETGEYIVMNTSFNLGGEPLVETPAQAVLSFTFGGFDALWLEGYLISRR
ncbi:nodulation protein [Ignicoccus pacificus DSM 13166]|uniref:Nodulation protein n=1 Tax=Ignicoccus pacificus DSM 13166 TaxID=940294 RepID=A0A977K9D7_9CREN|nr:nodulation protein [Ignicoccus pacificus DSM 13166]